MTADELKQTLKETVHDLQEGRITPRQANEVYVSTRIMLDNVKRQMGRAKT